jgi:hypothetical protein
MFASGVRILYANASYILTVVDGIHYRLINTQTVLDTLIKIDSGEVAANDLKGWFTNYGC